ncbi:uncharacterized protein LOC129589368 [Paramacrobiotus metropolitanus]|uniref:uncharacterized protein LOC129589368 n=1 Tax=Paramacrobiotus metropolitanus TaxID=2943436 RepID=UPI002445CBCD|nr:uncharacterized protein LOC129589368 [Paramacrobiotus metropolitanus]
MPKRAPGNESTGPSPKRSKSDAPPSGKRKKGRLASPPLSISVVKWECVDGDEQLGTAHIASSYQIAEPTLPSWKQIFAHHRKDTASCDLAITTKDGAEILAHSLILRIRIPFFESYLPVFKPLSGETTTRPSPIIITAGWVDRPTLNQILDFAYFVIPSEGLSDDQLQPVFAAALHMQWAELEAACEEQFQQRLQTGNCLSWLEWAVQNKNETVKNRAANFAATNMDALQDLHEMELKQISLEAHLAIIKTI